MSTGLMLRIDLQKAGQIMTTDGQVGLAKVKPLNTWVQELLL